MTTPQSSPTAPLKKPNKKPRKKPIVAGGHDDSDEQEEEEEEEEAVKIARREALARILRDDLRTPYLTCQRCNSVTFINVNRVRPTRRQPQTETTSTTPDLSVYEQLPVCSGCGTTKYLRAGVVSFLDKIAEEQQQIKAFEQKRVPATHLLLRIARGFLGRLAFRRRRRAHELHLWTIRVAATRIQSRIRGIQARTRTLYERCLRVIRTMHPSILKFALAATPDRKPVFWYEHTGELQILYWNYREFVRRAGGKPPLFKVESNIMEITRRMLQREHELVSCIQSRWRGLATRLVMVEFKRQRGWLRGLQQSPATKIQRVVRRHHATQRCRALRAVSRYPDQLAAYRDERAQLKQQETAKAFRKKLLSKYRRTYQTDRSCKMLALARPEDEEDQSEVVAEAHVEHSLRTTQCIQTRSSDRLRGREPEDELRQRHPNARKLLEIKRLVDTKQQRRVRGPRLHILHAQNYADEPDG